MNNFPSSTWQLDAAPESTDHVQIEDSYGLFINGKFQPSTGGETYNSINPATEKKIASITEANSDDVDKAVKACLLYTSPSPRDQRGSRMPSSA